MSKNIKSDTANNYKFYNPSDTRDLLYKIVLKREIQHFDTKKNKKVKKDWYYECEDVSEKNISLLFSKFIPESTDANEKQENKDKYLEFVIREFENYKRRWSNFTHITYRIEKLIEHLKIGGYHQTILSSKCHWRLVIGLGAAHPQETSMTLHHIYGIPYIPGSAIKGVTKHWAVQKFAAHLFQSQNNNDFEKTLKEISEVLDNGKEKNIIVDDIKFNDLIKIFGTQKKAGEVIFMDAFPIGDVKLKMDIMNPHYQDYYNGINAPADWLSPNPIKFLTVEETIFQFYLLSKNQELLTITEKLLKEALKESGIGAKTSLGYGLFDI